MGALLLTMLTALVAGCAALGIPVPGQVAEVAAGDAAPSVDEAPPRVPRPHVSLDADLVFNYLLADVAERRGRPDVALEAAVRVAERTRDPVMVLRAFRAAMRDGDAAAALAMADLLGEIDNDPVRVGFARVQALLAAGSAIAAREEIARLLEEHPARRERIFNNAGEVYAQQGDAELYLEHMKHLADAHPDDKHGYFALAYAANRARNYPMLGEAVVRALELDPDWEQAAIVRYAQLIQMDDRAAAREFADAFMARNPDALLLAERQARLLAASGDMEAARTRFEQILERQPDNEEILYAAALVHMQLAQWEGARALLRRHLELNPRSDETRMHLGRVAQNLEEFDEAIEWYGRVTDDALVFEAQRLVATALESSRGSEAALEHVRALVPSNLDEEVELLLTQEQILRGMNRLDEAFALIDGALSEIPDNGDLLYARALLAAELRMLPRHEEDIRRVIELEPDNAHAYNALGYTLADQTTRYEEALVLITRALELAPNDPFILDSMGWVQFRLGHLGEAEGYLRRALEIRQDAEIAAHLGEVLWTGGGREEARALWNDALAEDPDNRTLLDTLNRLDPR